MAKKRSLLEEIQQLPRQKIGKKTWYERLRDDHPDLYAEIAEVIRDFNNRGAAYEVFGSAAQMKVFLLKKDEERTGPKALNGIGDCSFRNFVEYIKTHPNG